jgi:hypothetical protein
MSDDQNSQAQLPMAMEAYSRDVHAIIEQGREVYGDGSFDQMSADVGQALGGQQAVLPFMAAVRECDAPVEVIRYLSDNLDEAKAIGQMSDARRITALARIEARLLPHANGVSASADPA